VFNTADDLRFSVMMGLREGLKMIRGMRQQNEDQRRVVAAAIVDHLELSNRKIDLGPEKLGHSRLSVMLQRR
jgi:hypothetical protein